MKKAKCMLLAVLFLATFSDRLYSQTAKIEISIENFPWLLIESYTYFKADKEIMVEKVSENNFMLSYFGNKPKSFFLNFREILISPGDSMDLIYRSVDQSPNNPKDLLIVSGKNRGNYIFTNLIKSRMPENWYPDYKQDKYLNNIGLLCNTLKENFGRFNLNFADTLKKLSCDEKFSAYLLRTANFKYLTGLYYLKDNLKNYPAQTKEINSIIDNTFLNTNFVKTDTSYSYFMEIAFNNYFTKMVIPRFNNLNTEKDYIAAIDYLDRYPNNFIREYFIYFLATDYQLFNLKYQSKNFNKLIETNPHIGKVRNVIMDKSNVYH